MPNQWLDLKPTSAPVRHVHLSRPGVYTPPPAPPVPQGRMIYAFAYYNPGSGANQTQIVWSPQSDPPQYVAVERWHADEAGGNNASVGWMETNNRVLGVSLFSRIGAAVEGRGYSKEAIPLPPGFTSISLFRFAHTDEADSRSVASRIPAGFESAWNDITHAQGKGDPSVMWGVDPNGRAIGQFFYGKTWSAAISGSGVYLHPADPAGSQGTLVEPASSPANDHTTKTAERPYEATTIARAMTVLVLNDPLRWNPVYISFSFDPATGTFAAFTFNGASFGNTDDSIRLWTNEYILWNDVLYYLTMEGATADGYLDLVTQAVPVTGLTGALPTVEGFDTHWMLTDAVSTAFKIFRRDPDNPANFIEWVKPGLFTTYWDSVFGVSNYFPFGNIATTNLTSEAVFVLRKNTGTPMIYRLVLVRADGTWADVSGNIWQAVGMVPALFSEGTKLYSLRHVLDTEYDPTQAEPDNPTTESPPAPSTSGAYPQAVIASGPHFYFRLSDAAETRFAYDVIAERYGIYSEAGITRQVAGLVTGDADTAAQFDNGSLGVGGAKGAHTGSWSLECILNRSANGASAQYFFDTNTPRLLLYFRANSNTLWWSSNTTERSLGAIPLGTSHIVVTANRSTNVLRLYVNGAFVGQATYDGAELSGTSSYIMNNTGGSGSPTVGTLDEVAFYKSVISDAEILDHAQKAGFA